MLAAQPGTSAAAAARARTQYGMGRGLAAGHSNMTAGKKTPHHKQTARKLPSQAQKTRQTARKATGTSVPASLAAAAGGAVPFTPEQQLQQALELLPASLPDDGLLERFTVPEDDPRVGLRGQQGVRIKATAGRVDPGTILSAYGNYCMPHSDNWALQQQAPGWLQEEYCGCHPAAARKAWELCLEVGLLTVSAFSVYYMYRMWACTVCTLWGSECRGKGRWLCCSSKSELDAGRRGRGGDGLHHSVPYPLYMQHLHAHFMSVVEHSCAHH
jgi:hypothetical protein